MGAILHFTETLRSPLGIVILIAIIGGGYLFYKWVFSEPKESESEETK